MKKNLLPVICGPTASGKSALAVELARRMGGEVVSADSMQVYAGLPIGTAVPGEQERRGIPHHLMGFLPLAESFSVAQYAALAHQTIAEIAARGHQPILCGGTGLYIRAVCENLQFTEQQTDTAFREAMQRRAETQGGEILLAELAEIDPETAARLHPRDHKRIIRALEICRLTGGTAAEQLVYSRSRPSPYDARLIMLDCRDRGLLYRRIGERADNMIAGGLAGEARMVIETETAPTAKQAIGYKELAPWIAGEISREQAAERLKQETRRYAKRQLTWFRHMAGVRTLWVEDYDGMEELAGAAMTIIREVRE
ncbi:MAG: tRNA (adenosine(37)-N6)-dimethylallyltransferase MiaA [Oscillospiraceae bacterium]|nr:tRNA (adenosine(37)-N6)-dimethylallyltransferase MiaA [Oscillospiraceae bacterium]